MVNEREVTRSMAAFDPVWETLTRKEQSRVMRLLVKRIDYDGEHGIEKRVHAHGLRHTHAAELRSEGVDIGIISKQLGHRSIATTARYLDHIAPYAVVDAISKRAWA